MTSQDNLTKEDRKMLRSVFWRSWTMNASRTGATQYHAVGVIYTLLPVINRFIRLIRIKQRHWSVIQHGSMPPCTSITLSWVLWHRWKRKTVKILILMLVLLRR